MGTGLRRRRDPVEMAVVALVRLVTDDGWSPEAAAEQLRGLVADDAVLRRARARIDRALPERASLVAARATATLDAALTLPRIELVEDADQGRRAAPLERAPRPVVDAARAVIGTLDPRGP